MRPPTASHDFRQAFDRRRAACRLRGRRGSTRRCRRRRARPRAARLRRCRVPSAPASSASASSADRRTPTSPPEDCRRAAESLVHRKVDADTRPAGCGRRRSCACPAAPSGSCSACCARQQVDGPDEHRAAGVFDALDQLLGVVPLSRHVELIPGRGAVAPSRRPRAGATSPKTGSSRAASRGRHERCRARRRHGTPAARQPGRRRSACPMSRRTPRC